ncbi:nucleotidyltransferase domain-containing protein [Siccirubricoccus phaeus]|uniref:nucleotidyltransferase domain-containing protein n=1 Tax=Siccirubricoccus phaeus TaxID=2595053 RepID=UPI0011F0A47C|nr:nucleotidyltransferase domain-containing protein [Siccirubricoccus phaeus]
MERPLTEYRFLQALRDLPFVEAIWLFGSRARGFARDRSDIDLALLCPRATAADWTAAEAIVEGADTLLSIDLVRFDALPEGSELRQAILRTHVPLFERRAA